MGFQPQSTVWMNIPGFLTENCWVFGHITGWLSSHVSCSAASQVS
jgi:hypothetical protein